MLLRQLFAGVLDGLSVARVVRLRRERGSILRVRLFEIACVLRVLALLEGLRAETKAQASDQRDGEESRARSSNHAAPILCRRRFRPPPTFRLNIRRVIYDPRSHAAHLD